MNRKLKNLERLQKLTDAALLAQQARLASIAGEEARITSLLETIDDARAARNSVLNEGMDPAQRAGADPLWQLWADGRRSSLNRDLAKVRVMREDVRSDLARALGRDDVASRLLGKVKSADLAARWTERDQTS